jgi:hypothetical protein
MSLHGLLIVRLRAGDFWSLAFFVCVAPQSWGKHSNFVDQYSWLTSLTSGHHRSTCQDYAQGRTTGPHVDIRIGQPVTGRQFVHRSWVLDWKIANHNLEDIAWCRHVRLSFGKMSFRPRQINRVAIWLTLLCAISLQSNGQTVTDSVMKSRMLISQGKSNEALLILDNLVKYQNYKNDVLMYRSQAHFKLGEYERL